MKDLNILKTGYIKGFRHIFHNIKQFFKNCKYAWQRATKGYSDLDLLDLESFYSYVISTSMQQFDYESSGFPRYMSYDEWICKVKEISNKINKCNDLYDEYIHTDTNKLSNRNFYIEYEEAKKITTEGYKELGEIIHHLWN